MGSQPLGEAGNGFHTIRLPEQGASIYTPSCPPSSATEAQLRFTSCEACAHACACGCLCVSGKVCLCLCVGVPEHDVCVHQMCVSSVDVEAVVSAGVYILQHVRETGV